MTDALRAADDPHVRLVYKYRLAPHTGDWRQAKAYREGWETVNPLIVYTVNDTFAPKHLPPKACYGTISADNVVVTAIKKAEDDDAVLIRCFETEGRDASAEVSFVSKVKGCSETDLLEENPSSADPARLHFSPWEVKTLKLEL